MSGPDNRHRASACPITFALDRFGDKWSLLVVRDLLFRGKTTYGEFLEAGEGIATNVLADRLKQLEAAGILRKTRDPANKRRYLYSLTDKGLDLTPVLLEMIRWSARHDPHSAAPRAILEQLEQDRDQLIEQIRAGIKL